MAEVAHLANSLHGVIYPRIIIAGYLFLALDLDK